MSDRQKGGSMEGISELLRCYICMERLSNATICPHCSKLGCFTCIKRWVTDNRSNCPHCRNALTLRDLIKIPLFDDLGQVLDTLHACTKEVEISSSPEQEKCSTHQEKMSVYCETCKNCICHECALWSEEHRSHSFKPLDVLYKKHVELLEGELGKLKERMKQVLSHVQQVEKKIEGVKINKSKVKRELSHAMDKMCHKLDELAKEKVTSLNEFRHHLRSQAVEITKESHDLEKTITAGNISSLLDSNGELKNEVSATLKRLLTSPFPINSLPSTSNFVNEVVPEYDSAFFKITSFRELQRRGEEIYSKPLDLQGLIWRLKVYPNGHKEEVGNYLGVFVELSEGYNTVTNCQYNIEMLFGCSTKHPHRNHVREYASEFADGESWGYRKFYELSRLHEDGFLKDDTLILKFSVRPPTYHQKFLDHSIYLEKVVKERDALKQQLEAAKQQISSLKSECKVLLADRPRHTSNSRTMPSQHENRTPLTMHSSQQHIPRHSHHNSSHHSSHQNRKERSSHFNQDEGRMRSGMSHPFSHHPSPSHNPIHSHSSPKRSPFHHHSDSRVRHGDRRMIPGGENLMSSSHMALDRRMSNEDSTSDLRKSTEERRQSADVALLYSRDQDLLAPHEQQLFQNSPKHQSNTQPNSEVLTTKFKSSNSTEDLELGFSQQCDEGTINPSDIIITLDEEEEKNKSTSSSSTLIDDESPPQEVQMKQQLKQKKQHLKHKQQELSQEPFEDELLSLSSLPGHGTVPLSNYPSYYDSSSYFGEHQESFPHTSSSKTKHDQNQSHLSQPTFPSPPKHRHGKSLTDLTGSNPNLSYSQQFLSQSVADFQHMQQQQEMHHYSDSSHHENRRFHEHRYRPSQSKLPRMSSDSHLNRPLIPGLQVSIISALSEVQEEGEQKKQARERKTSPHQQTHMSSQGHSQSQKHSTPPHKGKGKQLQTKHLKATVVSSSDDKTGQRTSPCEKRRPESKGNPKSSPSKIRSHSSDSQVQSSSSMAAVLPVEAAATTDGGRREEDDSGSGHETGDSRNTEHITIPTSRLSSKVKTKSNSTSSLNNLSQIL